MFKRIREDIACVFDRDPAARNVFEVLTTYPGVHAVLWHRLNHTLWRWKLKWLARWLSTFARWVTGIEIHPGAKIGRRFFIDHGMGVVIGETAEIGNDCTLYHGVTLGGTSWLKGKRHPKLEDNVVIGAGAKVLGPITLGARCRVGSNAVVLKNVPADVTVVGVPGRIVTGVSESQQKMAAAAKKMGFDFYGMHKDMPDPVADAINAMIEHMHETDRKLQLVLQTLQDFGAPISDLQVNELETSELMSSIKPVVDQASESLTSKSDSQVVDYKNKK